MSYATSATLATPGPSNRAVALFEPNNGVRGALVELLQGEGWSVSVARTRAGLEALVAGGEIGVVISDYDLPADDAPALLGFCREQAVPVIFIGRGASLQRAVDLARGGAADVLEMPFPQSRLLEALNGLSGGQPSHRGESVARL